MSEPLAVVLEHDTLRVFGRASTRPLVEAPWNADDPAAAVEWLAAQSTTPSVVTLVVGLAWLEFAQPSLPPVAPALRRRMLHLAADRWFAMTGPAAFAMQDELAMAMPADRLHRWRAAFAEWAPVAAVVTVPQAAWLMDRDGAWRADAGPGEHGAISVRDDRLVDVRRTRRDLTSGDPLDVGACAVAVLNALPIPALLQLVDVTTERALEAQQQRRWWRAGVVLAVASVACVWALSAARERQLEATQALVARLESESAPAQAANARLQRALAEQAGLRADAARATRSDAPARVLARIGTLLPTDAFVQRLEWDGIQWRIDGSAIDAAALVPKLDADTAIEDVRTLAPSTRFLDGGRPRTSFSIGFRVREGA